MTSVAESSDNYSATSRPDSTIIEPASVYHRVSYAYRYSRCRPRLDNLIIQTLEGRRVHRSPAPNGTKVDTEFQTIGEENWRRLYRASSPHAPVHDASTSSQGGRSLPR